MPDRRRATVPPMWAGDTPDPVPRPLECEREEEYRQRFAERIGAVEPLDILAARVDTHQPLPQGIPLYVVPGSDDGEGWPIVLRLDALFASRSERTRRAIEAPLADGSTPSPTAL